jgi:hypothetical protein
MRKNVVIGSVALTLTAGLLGACGGGNSSSGASGSYCSDLKADKSYFESFSGGQADLGKLDEVFTRMHNLADEAPSNVSADWKTLDGAITSLQNALKAAGLKPSDLAKMQQGQMPSGADVQKLQTLESKLQAMNSGDVTKAGDRITADAKKSCGVDLSSS